MPFTLSHAVAVLPVIRRDGTGRGPLVPSALVAGSFAPDMTYFAASVLPGAMEFGEVTHSFLGVFTVDVLVVAALVGVWRVLREPLVALLPRTWQGRTYALLRGGGEPGRRSLGALFVWGYVSAVLGAATHVVWDAFTHFDRWGMRVFPALGETVAGFPLYWYAQYGGSALALVAIALFVASALRRVAPAEPVGVPQLSVRGRWLAGAVLGGCAVVAAVHRALRWWEYWGATAKPWELIPTVCFGAGAGLAVGLVVYGVALRALRPAGPNSAAADASASAAPAEAEAEAASADAGP
ncbi:DUF4184 family protein [Streptomyces sp. PSKA54]|uniref:DUF4184 family protein n=1 Tax=Streptomyces himalayensis subsp. aureolus TaxID=2758039 RepID=A0A7W2HDX1_9ACTN|nr:DUF4184 family protein [Streptomyces himalayensis]MBA4860024.1 DUF4184 family protein [Streptomyces himalayensis subsp. aureolus]